MITKSIKNLFRSKRDEAIKNHMKICKLNQKIEEINKKIQENSSRK